MPRTRLKPQARRAEILAAAARMVVEQGYLPLPLEALAQQIGISKALIYRYFQTQHHLINAIINEHLAAVAAAERNALSGTGDLATIAERCALIYFDHVADHGALLHILMSDLYCVSHIERGLLLEQGRIIGRLARLARASLGLGARESLAVVRLLAALAEEAGTQAFRGQNPRELCRSTLTQLIGGGLDGLRRLGV